MKFCCKSTHPIHVLFILALLVTGGLVCLSPRPASAQEGITLDAVGNVSGGIIGQASGSAAETLTIGTQRLDLGILDADQNIDPSTRQIITGVEIHTGLGDSELVDLIEIAPAVGYFRIFRVYLDGLGYTSTSGLPLSDTAGLVFNDGILFCRDGETISVLYTSAVDGDTLYDTAVTVVPSSTGEVQFADSTLVNFPSYYTTEETAYLRVSDPDANRNPVSRDTVIVSVQNLVTGDSVSLILTESLAASALFVSDTSEASDTATQIHFSTAGVMTLGDTSLFCLFDALLPYNVLQLTYVDAVSGEIATDTALVVGPLNAAGFFSNATGSEAETEYTVPGEAHLLMVNPEGNANPAVRETITAEVRSLLTGDSERVSLEEIGPSFGIFLSPAGSIILSDTSGTGKGDGVLFTQAGDTLSFWYQDESNILDVVTGEAAINHASSTAVIRFTGENFDISAAPDTVIIGSGIYVAVLAADQNDNPFSPDTIALGCTIVSPRGDSIQLTLVESIWTGGSASASNTSTLFTNFMTPVSLSDTTGLNDTAVLFALSGDELIVTYAERTSGIIRSDTILTIGGVSAAAQIWPVGMDTSVTPARLILGETVSVRLYDADRNADSLVLDTAPVMILSGGHDTVTLILTEESVASGIFSSYEGIAARLRGAGFSTSDSILNAAAGESVILRYVDPSDAMDSAQTAGMAVLPSSMASGAFTDAVLTNISTYTIGETVYVRLTDPDRNRSGVIPDSLTVTVRSLAVGDVDTLLLTETGDSTGIFFSLTGLGTVRFTGFLQAGLLNVNNGETIRFEYTDPYNPSDSLQGTAAVFSPGSGGGTETITYILAASAGGNAVASVIPGEEIYLRDLFVPPLPALGLVFSDAAVDSFTLTFYATGTGDWVSALFTEDTAAAQTFNNTGDPVTTALFDGFQPAGEKGGDNVLEILPYNPPADVLGALDAQGAGSVVILLNGNLLFGLPVQAAVAVDLDQLLVYPNPFKPTDGRAQTGSDFVSGNPATGILFAPVPADFRLRIFTLDGRLVTERRGETELQAGRYYPGSFTYQWDARNKYGVPAASGVYLWVLESSAGRRTGKLAIIR